ncbi:hypothetical protein Tco_0173764 [Tanacetum coccineum]
MASISVLINGSPSKDFKKERGLRKGDHLSSLLFLLVAEALQVAIMEACSKELFKGSSGLKVNISKSRLIGVGVPTVNVEQVAEPLIELSTKCRLCISIWVSVALAPKTNVCWKSGYGDFSLKKMHFGQIVRKQYKGMPDWGEQKRASEWSNDKEGGQNHTESEQGLGLRGVVGSVDQCKFIECHGNSYTTIDSQGSINASSSGSSGLLVRCMCRWKIGGDGGSI